MNNIYYLYIQTVFYVDRCSIKSQNIISFIFTAVPGVIPSAVPIRKLPFLLNFYDFYSQFAFYRTKKLRLMRVLIIFMLLCSALSLPRKKNTKTLLIETVDKEADGEVSTF